MKLGLIGAGNIGGAIGANLLADGHELSVFDTDRSKTDDLVRNGARAASSSAEVGRESEITFTSLPSPTVMAAVTGEWLGAAAPGSILVDLSTNAPVKVREVAQQISAHGCHLLEAPLTGGVPGAKARMLVFMVGGDAAVYERVRPLLDRLGRATFHLGPLGFGNTAKLVNSLMAFAGAWISLEGLAIATKTGIPMQTMVDVIRTGGAGNYFIDRLVDGLGVRGKPTTFALELAAKDAGLLMDVAREVAVPAPVAAEVAQALVAAVAAGLGQRDFTEWVELIEKQAGVQLGSAAPTTPTPSRS